jgi:hypothetical protein
LVFKLLKEWLKTSSTSIHDQFWEFDASYVASNGNERRMRPMR